VFNERFSSGFDAVSRRKRLVLGLVAVVTVAAGIDLRSISLDNSIDRMLPEDGEIRRSMLFLRESHFSDSAIISLEVEPSDHASEDLVRAVAQLEGYLGPPFVTEVVTGVSTTDMVEETLSLLRYVPQLLDEGALLRIGEQITPEGVEASLRRNFLQLVGPASSFTMPLVRSDPLGMSFGVLRSLQELSSSVGYEVEIEAGRFISRDRAHAMLIARTPIPVTDASGARGLIGYIREQVEKLPEWVSADIIAGHLHTISNEDVIKRDIWLALSIAGVAFLLLFLLLFRDIRAAMLFLLPVVSVLVSIRLSHMVLGRLSYFIVGMGGVVTGIAVDYGIHVYMAIRAADGRADAVKVVAKPVVIGALTTLGVFAAFFFSSVQGYHQLAFFSILSIGLCLACALFLLPHLLGRPRRVGLEGASAKGGLQRFRDRDAMVIACWVLAMVGGVVSSSQLSFESDIREFDGSEPKVFQAEAKFHRVWGGKEQPAVFVVPGGSLDEALRRNRLVYRDAMAVMGGEGFSSLSAIWPPKEERAANAARWRGFWRQGRESELKRLLREHGAAYDFSAEAFSPFFESLYAGAAVDDELEGVGVFSRLRERFVQEGQGGYRVLSFFPDEERFVSGLSAVSGDHPGTFVVSRNAISRALSRSVSAEIVYLAAIAALLIPILACLLLRDPRLTVLALVPVATGITAVLGMIPVLGLSMTAPSVISAMVVVGLCIDYGIFVVYAYHHDLETGTHTAVTLSAVTTLIGTGALLLASHPVLFSIGVTMVTGVLGGYVSSMLVVPSLYRRLMGEGVEAS
jgi:predicted RND superfamily exporter protein